MSCFMTCATQRRPGSKVSSVGRESRKKRGDIVWEKIHTGSDETFAGGGIEGETQLWVRRCPGFGHHKFEYFARMFRETLAPSMFLKSPYL